MYRDEAGIWRKSSRSANNTACVEVGYGLDTVGIRDTKDRSAGTFEVSHEEWKGFLATFTK